MIAMTMRGSASISPPFDGAIDHAIPPCREDGQHSSKTDHAFPERFRDAGVAHAHRRTCAGRHLAHPRLNRAITNPKLITAMLVRTQARNVHSLARISASILSGSSRPFSC